MRRRQVQPTRHGQLNATGANFEQSPADPVPDERVAIFGHSQVGALSRNYQGPVEYQGAGGEIKKFSVSFFKVPGATVPRLRESPYWQSIILLRPALLFLCIGSNDLDSPNTSVQSLYPPRHFFNLLKELIQDIARETGAEVHIVEIEPRRTPRHITKKLYRTRRSRVNTILKKNSATKNNFFSVPGTVGDLAPDGVHLDCSIAPFTLKAICNLSRKLIMRDIERTLPLNIPSHLLSNQMPE